MRPALPALILLALACPATAEPPLGYNTTPLGSPEQPLILRTYCPDPGLDPAVFPNHGKGANSPRYSAKSGRDQKGEYTPIKGVPAAIAVNHGPALSYVFDTTECRLLYAWQGGFLDLLPYWGDQKGGSRRSFDYVPRLIGTVFYQAAGPHPLGAGKPEFLGYKLNKGIPTFRYTIGGKEFQENSLYLRSISEYFDRIH